MAIPKICGYDRQEPLSPRKKVVTMAQRIATAAMDNIEILASLLEGIEIPDDPRTGRSQQDLAEFELEEAYGTLKDIKTALWHNVDANP